nr:probable protein phosphatase 2C 49 [Tanacetum cinerariifolium]
MTKRCLFASSLQGGDGGACKKDHTMMKMKMTEKSNLQLNILLDDAVSISKKLVVMKCSASTKSIRSGSHTDIRARISNEDQHIKIDDVANHLSDDVHKWETLLSSFYVIFDGHGGTEAASYVKEHAMRLFFESSNLPEATTTLDGFVDELFLKELQDFHCKRHLLISNAGDCRVVISRKGVAKQMSNDHGPSNLLEKKRVKELGGCFEEGYLNGELAVTQALGDRLMKLKSPLIDC